MTKRMIAVVAVGLVISVSGLAGAEKAESKPVENAVATVGGRPIRAEELRTLLEKRSSRPATAEEKRQLLEEMVNFELLLAAAQQAGYDRDPELQAAYRRMLAGKYREKFLQPKLEGLAVSDAEIYSYYREHRQLFATPRTVRAAVIKVAIPSMASAETRSELQHRAEKARVAALALDPATTTFGSVAVEFSSDQASRYRGGDTGWIDPARKDGQWPEGVLMAIQALGKAGEVSPVITLDDGFYLLKLIEAKDAAVRPLEKARGEVYQRVMRAKQTETELAFFAELKRSSPVTINEKVLETIKLPKEGAAQRPPALPRQ
jgi:peptidyl-prolyl cis-trans isomerase C